MSTIEHVSTNIYADSGLPDAEEMLEYLTRLVRNIEIVIKTAPRSRSEGLVTVVFA